MYAVAKEQPCFAQTGRADVRGQIPPSQPSTIERAERTRTMCQKAARTKTIRDVGVWFELTAGSFISFQSARTPSATLHKAGFLLHLLGGLPAGRSRVGHPQPLFPSFRHTDTSRPTGAAISAPPCVNLPSLAFSSTVLATMFSSSIKTRKSQMQELLGTQASAATTASFDSCAL